MIRKTNSIMIVAGTRPELIKLAPVISEFNDRNLPSVFIWSGQHFDYEMSKIFFSELEISKPDLDLGIKGETHATQTARIMMAIEGAIKKYSPTLVIALGDTNTVVAVALASVKMNIPFVHIEAGLRSWDENMPEEINRRITDHIAQLLFAPSKLALLNLLNEGIPQYRAYLTGNTIVDTIRIYFNKVEENVEKILERLSLEPNNYILATFHRQENVDNPERLQNIVKAIVRIAENFKVVIPLHPRTRKRLHAIGLLSKIISVKNIIVIPPLGYINFLALLSRAAIVLTDSGGVQEEAFTLKIPTITLRYNTERPETVILGCNMLVGTDEECIVNTTIKIYEHKEEIKNRLINIPNPYGNGYAAKKIGDIIEEKLLEGISLHSPDLRAQPFVTYAIRKNTELKTEDEILSFFDDHGLAVADKSKAKYIIVRTKIQGDKFQLSNNDFSFIKI